MSNGQDALTSTPTREGTIEIDDEEYSFETTPPTRNELNALDEEHPDTNDEIEWAYIMIDEFLDSFDGDEVEDVGEIPMDRALSLHAEMQLCWTDDVRAAMNEMVLDEGNQ
jgi:hypothetical protein